MFTHCLSVWDLQYINIIQFIEYMKENDNLENENLIEAFVQKVREELMESNAMKKEICNELIQFLMNRLLIEEVRKCFD